jgi:hypothetical protein
MTRAHTWMLIALLGVMFLAALAGLLWMQRVRRRPEKIADRVVTRNEAKGEGGCEVTVDGERFHIPANVRAMHPPSLWGQGGGIDLTEAFHRAHSGSLSDLLQV